METAFLGIKSGLFPRTSESVTPSGRSRLVFRFAGHQCFATRRVWDVVPSSRSHECCPVTVSRVAHGFRPLRLPFRLLSLHGASARLGFSY